MPYTKKNGDGKLSMDWSKILESLIGGLALAVVIGALNWIFIVRDIRIDLRVFKKDFKHAVILLSTQNTMNTKSLWNHLHPDEPCPIPEIDFGFIEDKVEK